MYILEMKLLFEFFVNIFSLLLVFLFVLLMVSFAVQNLLSLINSYLFIFPFFFFCLGRLI